MNTKALRQKILDLAIHGKLVPQDPNDEPASVLLERIRDEKERLIKEGKIKRPKKTKTTSDKPHYPYELPKGWVWTTLGEIGNWQSGVTPSRLRKDYYGGNIPWLKTGDLNDGYISDIPEYITETALKETSVKLNPKDSVLIAMYGATIGKVGILSFPATTNQACCACTDYLVKKMYLFYFLLANRENFIAMGGGGAQPNISKEKIVSTLIPLPPMQEQIRIVEGIEHWFSLVDCIEGNKDNLQKIIKEAKSKILTLAIHGKLVPQDPTDEPAAELLKRINPKAEITCDNGHYQKLPEGWTILKVGNVAEYINGRAFKPEEWEQTGLPIIRIQNLNDPNAYYNRTKNEYEEKYLIKKGDLLFAWAASLGTYIWKGEDAWLNQHIFKVIPYPFMYKKYLYYAFHAMITEFYRKSHGSGMIHITRKQFEEITLWLPPLTEQYRIVQYLQQVFEKLDSIVENL
jgi:type I restriction enzyme S subunit